MDAQKPKTNPIPPPADIPFAKDTPVPIKINPTQSSPFPSQRGKVSTPETIGIPLHVRSETIPPSLKPQALKPEPVLPPIIKESPPAPTENIPLQTEKKFSLHVKAESASDSQEFSPQKAIAIILAFLFIVWLFWFLFIKTSPEGVENIVDSSLNMATSTLNINIGKTTAPEKSFYDGWIKITSIAGVKETYPEKEYITMAIVQENASSIDISNWYLMNKKGVKAKIGQASHLPYFGKVNKTDPLMVNGRDTVIISTGRSPIGTSFRTNSCSPYLEQFRDFIPPINTAECPEINRKSDAYKKVGNICEIFINSLPRCEMFTGTYPSNITADCKSYINIHGGYNGCVTDRLTDTRFYKKEWRVFLGGKTELWDNKSDVVSLYDDKDRIVLTVKY